MADGHLKVTIALRAVGGLDGIGASRIVRWVGKATKGCANATLLLQHGSVGTVGEGIAINLCRLGRERERVTFEVRRRGTKVRSVGSSLVDHRVEKAGLPRVERDGALPLLGTRLPMDVDGVGGTAV